MFLTNEINKVRVVKVVCGNYETMTWNVYCNVSETVTTYYDFSKDNDVRILIFEPHNDFYKVTITRNNAVECIRDFNGQLSDGFFENMRVYEVIKC